jgi:hypothetical protein
MVLKKDLMEPYQIYLFQMVLMHVKLSQQVYVVNKSIIRTILTRVIQY